MKLKPLVKNPATWLQEFDFWITPYLDDIKDSSVFIETKSHIKQALELIGSGNGQFSEPSATAPDHLTNTIVEGISGLPIEQNTRLVYAVFDLLFLVTGRTDNNLKCQFPVYLREVLGESTYPSVTRKGALKLVPVSRVLSSERIAVTISSLANHQEHQRALLLRYIQFILTDLSYVNSLYAIGRSYFLMKQSSTEDAFLLPLIVAFVRGSASAVGGHKPENHLRALMTTWGLTIDEDFNREDVVVYKAGNGNTDKTRAYDFVLPYKVMGWAWRIFIQSQFYAGDSGSVSHKNVDQTTKSRIWVKQYEVNAQFVEYVDGAGYYGSLNGDLKKLLNMSDTANFFQYRTSPIKLRQLLQSVGFLTPLELGHALSVSNLDRQMAIEQLENDGYEIAEIERVIKKSEDLGLIDTRDRNIKFDPAFRVTSRRYMLLDGIANQATPIAMQNTQTSVVLIPGYEHHLGLSLSEIGTLVIPMVGHFATDWSDPAVLLADIDFLATQKWVVIAGKHYV